MAEEEGRGGTWWRRKGGVGLGGGGGEGWDIAEPAAIERGIGV